MKVRFLYTFTVVSLGVGEAKETFFQKVASRCQQNVQKPQLIPD